MAGDSGGAIGVARAWLAGLIALGALYLVGTHGSGLATFFGGAEKFVSGTEGTVLKGGS
jgi:hypothetical protein